MATKIGFSDDWPKWAKPMFALAAAVLWIGAPMVAAWNLAARAVQAGGVVDYQPILVVLVGMTTATITGVFVFMTFRIDRGTQQEAERVAKETLERMKDEIETDAKRMKESADRDLNGMKKLAANELTKMINKSERSLNDTKRSRDVVISDIANAVKNVPQKVDKEVDKRFDEIITPERIDNEIAIRLSEEAIRRHIEAVLMVKANGQIVAEYAKKHADVLDSDVFRKLIQLLDEIIRPLPPDDPPERDDGGVVWWRRMRAYFTR